jgi:hypothetical protein
MNMRGLMTIKTIEEKAIRARNIRDRWHDIRLRKFQEEREDMETVYLIWALWAHPVVEGTPFSSAFTDVAPNEEAVLWRGAATTPRLHGTAALPLWNCITTWVA